MTLSIPRDRAGRFDPKLIAKYQPRFPDFDDKIISIYACGTSVREIRGHLEELYGIDVSAGLISAVLGGGHGMAGPIAGCLCYPLVFFDAVVRDVSSLGARVELRDTSKLANIFELTFDSGRTLRACRVVWRRSMHVGGILP
jgi:hypothetical protein